MSAPETYRTTARRGERPSVDARRFPTEERYSNSSASIEGRYYERCTSGGWVQDDSDAPWRPPRNFETPGGIVYWRRTWRQCTIGVHVGTQQERPEGQEEPARRQEEAASCSPRIRRRRGRRRRRREVGT